MVPRCFGYLFLTSNIPSLRSFWGKCQSGCSQASSLQLLTQEIQTTRMKLQEQIHQNRMLTEQTEHHAVQLNDQVRQNRVLGTEMESEKSRVHNLFGNKDAEITRLMSEVSSLQSEIMLRIDRVSNCSHAISPVGTALSPNIYMTKASNVASSAQETSWNFDTRRCEVLYHWIYIDTFIKFAMSLGHGHVTRRRSVDFIWYCRSDLCIAQRCPFQGTLRVRIWFKRAALEMGESEIALMSLWAETPLKDRAQDEHVLLCGWSKSFWFLMSSFLQPRVHVSGGCHG